jgi:hypothetical protein
MKDISTYFSIYKFKSDITVEHINFFDKQLNILSGKKCFIGQPLVEMKLIKKQKYINFLQQVIRKEGDLDYYAHPAEKYLEKQNLEGLTFHKNSIPIEKLFELEGVPEYIISYYSSSLLHIKNQQPAARIFYISNDLTISSLSINNDYEFFLEQAGIEKYPLQLKK